jgi:hypothetical protein
MSVISYDLQNSMLDWKIFSAILNSSMQNPHDEKMVHASAMWIKGLLPFCS